MHNLYTHTVNIYLKIYDLKLTITCNLYNFIYKAYLYYKL